MVWCHLRALYPCSVKVWKLLSAVRCTQGRRIYNEYFCHHSAVAAAPASFFPMNADCSGHTLTSWKWFRWSPFRMHLSESRLEIPAIRLPRKAAVCPSAGISACHSPVCHVCVGTQEDKNAHPITIYSLQRRPPIVIIPPLQLRFHFCQNVNTRRSCRLLRISQNFQPDWCKCRSSSLGGGPRRFLQALKRPTGPSDENKEDTGSRLP